MSIWSDSQLARVITEAEKQLASDLKYDSTRISLEVYANSGSYDLPVDCIGIKRVTWLGKKLEPKTFDEIVLDYPFILGDVLGTGFEPLSYTQEAFAVAGEEDFVPVSEPTHYIYTDFGESKIRLYPTPALSVAKDDSNLWGSGIGDTVIVEYISCDSALPNWIPKRLKRYLCLSKLFAIEGRGQDMEAAEYYQAKFSQLFIRAKSLVGKTTKALWLGQMDSDIAYKATARPMLPANYGRIVSGRR